MGRLLNLVTPLHQKTKRDYLGRMNDAKVFCMRRAKLYGYDYWDGDRRYGYGGYKYDGRWRPVAEELIKIYGLECGDKVLDVGCGKSHLLAELSDLGMEVMGFDISDYALINAHPRVQPYLYNHPAEKIYPFPDDSFDLVISILTLHNIKLPYLETALSEISRVGKNSFIVVESFRDELEQFNLECWALTAETLLDPNAWVWLFGKCNYEGDYEFVYFE